MREGERLPEFDQMRAIAEAATPGPWEAMADRCVRTQTREIIYDDSCEDRENADADMAYVETFDPPTVLALLDRVERADRVLASGVTTTEWGFIYDGSPEWSSHAYAKWDSREAAEHYREDARLWRVPGLVGPLVTRQRTVYPAEVTEHTFPPRQPIPRVAWPPTPVPTTPPASARRKHERGSEPCDRGDRR